MKANYIRCSKLGWAAQWSQRPRTFLCFCPYILGVFHQAFPHGSKAAALIQTAQSRQEWTQKQEKGLSSMHLVYREKISPKALSKCSFLPIMEDYCLACKGGGKAALLPLVSRIGRMASTVTEARGAAVGGTLAISSSPWVDSNPLPWDEDHEAQESGYMYFCNSHPV